MIWAASYYPVVGIQSSDRQGLVLAFVIQLFIYASSFAHLTIAAISDAHTAGSIVNVLAILSIIFSGVLQTATALPGFWYVSPRPLSLYWENARLTCSQGLHVSCQSFHLLDWRYCRN